MTDITIPPAALTEAEDAFLACDRLPDSSFEDCIRAAFLAMIEAWPGMRHYPDMEVFASKARIILPLTEKTDDKA